MTRAAAHSAVKTTVPAAVMAILDLELDLAAPARDLMPAETAKHRAAS